MRLESTTARRLQSGWMRSGWMPSRIGSISPRERTLLTLFVASQWIFGYNTVNFFTWNRHRVSTIPLAIDEATPMIASWVFIYVLAIVVAFAPVVCIPGRRFRVVALGYTMTMMTSLLIFLIFPVFMVRPPIPQGVTGAWLLSIVRTIDQPFNCFPSLHVSLNFLAAFYGVEASWIWGAGLWIMAFLIAASTMLTKQHYVLDIVSGFLLAALAYRLADKPAARQVVGA